MFGVKAGNESEGGSRGGADGGPSSIKQLLPLGKGEAGVWSVGLRDTVPLNRCDSVIPPTINF